MNWCAEAPCKGDIIRVPMRFYHHYGIYVSDDEVIQFGARDNTGTDPKDIRVIATDIAAFAEGQEVERAKLDREERHRRRKTDAIVTYARGQLGRDGYDILHNNCEHFVNECVFGEPASSFLDTVRRQIREKIR